MRNNTALHFIAGNSVLLIAAAVFLLGAITLIYWRRKSNPKMREVKQNDSGGEPGPWPVDLPPMETFAMQVLERGALQSTLYITDPTYRPTSPLATWIGRVIVGLPEETWPQANGLPMIGVCQLNISEAPFVPEALKEFHLIAFFVSRDAKRQEYEPPYERDKWEIRAYTVNQELVPYNDPPPQYEEWRPCAARPQVFTDYFSGLSCQPGDGLPDLSDHWIGVVHDYAREVLLPKLEALQNLPNEAQWGTKLGGWPASIQDDIERPLAFQIGSETDVCMNWVDAGCIYVWRTDEGWEVDVQFY